MTSDAHRDHLSDLRIDRCLAGDLVEAERAALYAHAARCRACAARLDEVLARRAAFAVPAPWRAAAPREGAVAPRASRGRWLGAAGALVAACAALALWIGARRPGEPADAGGRSKGSVELLVAVGPADRLVRFEGRAAARPGDSLQAGYSTDRDGFGAVLAKDERGQVFVYAPATGDALVALPAGRERSFPSSTVLDDALGAERLFVLWCSGALPVAPLVAQLQRADELIAPSGCKVRSALLEKTR